MCMDFKIGMRTESQKHSGSHIPSIWNDIAVGVPSNRCEISSSRHASCNLQRLGIEPWCILPNSEHNSIHLN